MSASKKESGASGAQKKDSGAGVKGMLGGKDVYQLTVVYVDAAPFHGMQQQREQERINTQIIADLQVAVEE